MTDIHDTHENCARYRIYDMAADDYVYSTRYATMLQIKRIGAEVVYPHVSIEKRYLEDGWTKRGSIQAIRPSGLV